MLQVVLGDGLSRREDDFWTRLQRDTIASRVIETGSYPKQQAPAVMSLQCPQYQILLSGTWIGILEAIYP
jgi:hypothetical protein